MNKLDTNHSATGGDVDLCPPLTPPSDNPPPEEEVVLWPLSTGGITKISPGDVDAVAQRVWRAIKINGLSYACTTMEHRRKYLHRLLCGTTHWDDAKGKWVGNQMIDHIDGDGLNNTRKNLRHCNSQQNQRNSRGKASSRSSYKGVSFYQSRKNRPWRATIHIAGKQIHGGFFGCEEEAARRYNALAREYFGEFFRPNKFYDEPDTGSTPTQSTAPP